jgi:hypothetical protein
MLFTQKTQGNEKYSCSRGATSCMYGSRKHIVFLPGEEETRLLSDYIVLEVRTSSRASYLSVSLKYCNVTFSKYKF